MNTRRKLAALPAGILAALFASAAGHYGVLFKAAFFDGNKSSGPPDTVKLWFQLVANF